MKRKYSIYIIYIMSYIISMMFSFGGFYELSGITLGMAAIGLYFHEYFKTKNPIDLKGLFSLFWVGGQSIACLKLSNLQGSWSFVTWLCFFLAYLGFCIGYEWIGKQKDRSYHQDTANRRVRVSEKRLFQCTVGLSSLSVATFLVEAIFLGFIPLFSKEPHAYSYFHISGLHYFTVACVLVPSLSVVYLKSFHGIPLGKQIKILCANILAVMIPILSVSRFQLLAMIILAIITYISLSGNFRFSHIVITAGVFLLLMIPAYFLLTIARNHEVEYLNGIFEMKNSETPIFITQPYMYVANNYDNFNCLVEQLPEHSYGLRMLFPLWAFTGLKFVVPELVKFPIYVTKEELTTVTLFYDAFYDFGVIGVLLLGTFCGWAASGISRLTRKSSNPISHVFYAQTAIYLTLSFFTTWLSNPTTWFWFVITGMIYWFVD